MIDEDLFPNEQRRDLAQDLYTRCTCGANGDCDFCVVYFSPDEKFRELLEEYEKYVGD